MKILLAGASGVLGRALLPHLRGHEVLGLTRSPQKVALLQALGADGAVCDIYVPGALSDVARRFRPEMVINFLTDLSGGAGPANARIRQEGGPVVLAAAHAGGATRLVVESISFPTTGASAAAVEALEEGARTSGLTAWVLRFSRLWGPGTWAASPPDDSAVHVEDAGRQAAAVIFGSPPGIYVIDGRGFASRP